MPLVSVIMPSYNHERFISESIESVLSQSMSDLEFIIIDDASSDGSKQIINGYQARDNRIKTIFHDTNMGIARTMNEGIDMATGKFIALFASDDLWVKDKLKKQFEALKHHEDSVIWSEGIIVDAQSARTGKLFTEVNGAVKRKKTGNLFNELLKGNYICGQSLILKSEYLKEIGYDEKYKYLNDYKLMVELSRKHEFQFIPEPLAMYRIHGKNTVTLKLEECYKEDILIRQELLQRFGSSINNTTKAAIYFRMGRLYDYFHDYPSARHFIMQSIRLDPYHFIKAGKFYIRKTLNLITPMKK